MNARMHLIRILRLIHIAPVVNDGRALQAEAAIGDAARFVDASDGCRVADAAPGGIIAVLIEAADCAVQIKKFLGGNGAVVQRREPVLYTDVVEWTTHRTGFRIA